MPRNNGEVRLDQTASGRIHHIIDVSVLQVSQSAYYDWLHRIPSFREREDEQLSGIVKKVFEKSRNTYGTRRLKIAMFHQGLSVGRRRISRTGL